MQFVLDGSVTLPWFFEDEDDAEGLTRAKVNQALQLIKALSIKTDTKGCSSRTLVSHALDCDLTAYDAAYLELALREGIAMATNDRKLLTAMEKVNVPRFQPENRLNPCN